MALPSTRRPIAVEEELQEESNKPKKLKVNLHQTFMDIMVHWYELMTIKQRGKLTASKLRNRALEAVTSMSYDYDRLPLDWVAQLAAATGMKLYERKKKEKDFTFLEERGTIQVVMDPLAMKQTGKQGSSTAASSSAIKKQQGDSSLAGTALLDKPILDLTHEPPPAEWLEAYAKGEHRRRELTVVPGKDTTVIFYDYNPRYKGPEDSGIDEEGKIASQPVHDGNSFQWFKGEGEPEPHYDSVMY